MEQQNIIDRLDRMEKILKNIQANMIDPDIILTEEERKMLDESVENEKAGKLTSSEDLRKELGI